MKVALYVVLLFLGSCENMSITHSSNSIEQDTSRIVGGIPSPLGYGRSFVPINSFASYLRNFALKDENSELKFFNGKLKPNQNLHAAILDIDVGKRDLQQCADAIMRLRAEYLYESDQKDKISFNFTNGFKADYKTWKNGNSISVNGNEVHWTPNLNSNSSKSSFRKYMNMIFAYAGTMSLEKELESKDISDIAIGDVFIQRGSPGHAVIVMDVTEQEEGAGKLFLLAQSYMPAQDIHVLKNLKSKEISPWYSVEEIKTKLYTPEWIFESDNLKSF